MKPTAFVTGATGFIGMNLVTLLSEHGWEIHALHRKESNLHYLKRYPVSLHQGCVTHFSTLLSAIPDNTHTIFHLAGDTSLWSGNNRKQRLINVEGTRNVIKAAIRKKVPNFIHTSSASAWGEMSGLTISEDLPQLGYRSWVGYERTKWEAEQVVLSYPEDIIRTTILNPTTVTGPFDQNNWGRLFFALRDGTLPGIPDGIVSVTHVREVAKAHLNAVKKGKHGERYLLSGEDCRFSLFVETIASLSGVQKLPRKVPTPLLKAAAYLSLLQAEFTGKAPDLTPELVKLMTRKDVRYSSQKAIEQLDYNIVPMEQSVRDTYEWLKSEKLL
ncbi:MAG: NAD-dependent epimerase/dehydratase family protein [Balneolaceae bacterium]